MEKIILEYLAREKVGALTVLLPDGTVHGAAMHFSHSSSPLELYFSTENTSKKTQGLVSGGKTKASVVLGFSEKEWITLQMDGEVEAILDKAELSGVQIKHYAKHPTSAKYKDDPATIFLKFTPTWWRYTDFNTNPVTILS